MSGAVNDNQDPTTFRGDKTICILFEDEEHYGRCLRDTATFRNHLRLTSQRHPELFPAGMEHGFTCKGTYSSKKQDVALRRIKVKASGGTFQVRPSFLMPYMVGRTETSRKAFFFDSGACPMMAWPSPLAKTHRSGIEPHSRWGAFRLWAPRSKARRGFHLTW